ncbi:GIY-YIG nuclease family protein [Massilia sp. YIM B02763]|uniref:GIY-YIG nuclease family protein n=1 Tax=Massilia sp. YIM B02763 TaxID=3050130 RepID=UPI0025B6F412|nr:GIY-YIG nuclease family protein [Massilia sp. YIM B02763]MDN4052881.1 GIY-YIG nuclease family protein [Massilia sp. YIM B02763]
MAYGFVYFLTNPSMPGLTKIGMTTKHPMERMEELSRSTACPTPFEMLAFFDTPEPRETEYAIHNALSEYRVSADREFFDAPPYAIADQFNEWQDPWGSHYRRPLDRLVEAFLRAEAAAMDAALGRI